MKLNKESKDILRKKIELELKSVPDGQRIKLDKNLLEELIFEVHDINSEYTNRKFIVWSGDFLSKIDLSEVSFDNVVWDIEYSDIDDLGDYNVETKVYTPVVNYYKGIEKINLSNTNIKVNFRNSIIYLFLRGVDLSNVDLSNNDLGDDIGIYNCNFSGTNIKFSFGEYFGCYDSDFSNLDLSDKNIDNIFYFSSIKNCNFSNTKLNIEVSKKDVGYPHYDEAHKNFISMLNAGKLEGCYVNGKLIPPLKSVVDKEKEKAEKLSDYNNYQKNIFDSVLGSIEEQKKKFR